MRTRVDSRINEIRQKFFRLGLDPVLLNLLLVLVLRVRLHLLFLLPLVDALQYINIGAVKIIDQERLRYDSACRCRQALHLRKTCAPPRRHGISRFCFKNRHRCELTSDGLPLVRRFELRILREDGEFSVSNLKGLPHRFPLGNRE